jgi:hypothetical protein
VHGRWGQRPLPSIGSSLLDTDVLTKLPMQLSILTLEVEAFLEKKTQHDSISTSQATAARTALKTGGDDRDLLLPV